LVKADAAGAPGSTIAEYQYDGTHQRIVKLKPNGANWDRVDYYYNHRAQVLEERTLTNTPSKTVVATVPKFQWVWDLRHLDSPILRDENKDGDGDCVDGTDERLYYVNDANHNTTALVSTAGAVVERYAYDPYGKASVFTAAWAAQLPTVYNNEVLFGGYRLDPETGLYAVRRRVYHPTLGRWLQRDPSGVVDGSNLYQYARSQPTRGTDPTGLRLHASDYAELVDPSPPPGTGRPDCTGDQLVAKVYADVYAPSMGEKCKETTIEVVVQIDTCNNDVNETWLLNPTAPTSPRTRPPGAKYRWKPETDQAFIELEEPVTCPDSKCCNTRKGGTLELQAREEVNETGYFTAVSVEWTAFHTGVKPTC